jgi:hypothetical protein
MWKQGEGESFSFPEKTSFIQKILLSIYNELF